MLLWVYDGLIDFFLHVPECRHDKLPRNPNQSPARLTLIR
jgi:hypothetical protein